MPTGDLSIQAHVPATGVDTSRGPMCENQRNLRGLGGERSTWRKAHARSARLRRRTRSRPTYLESQPTGSPTPAHRRTRRCRRRSSSSTSPASRGSRSTWHDGGASARRNWPTPSGAALPNCSPWPTSGAVSCSSSVAMPCSCSSAAPVTRLRPVPRRPRSAERCAPQARVQVPGLRLTLRMSIGVESGVFHLFLVGDSHRELIVAGPATSGTVAAESAADTGEIVVGPGTVASLRSSLLGAPKGPGRLLRQAPDVSPEGATSARDP